MSEDHTETMGDMFDRGLKLRREVLDLKAFTELGSQQL
jgi:hypothetical protein